MKKFCEAMDKNKDKFFLVFRIVIGVLFLMHGLMKLSAITSLSFNLMFFAGIIEIIGGAFIVIGLLTRPVALIAGLEMLYAFVFVHTLGKGFNINPLTNGGEAALLFLVSYIAILGFGPSKYSLDNKLFKKN